MTSSRVLKNSKPLIKSMASITWATRRFAIDVCACISIWNFAINRISGPRVTCFGLLFCLFFGAPLSGFAQKSLQTEDKTYEPQIRTVLCFASNPSQGLPPATAKLEAQNLMLEFDDLQEDRNNYYVRLMHCNYDWSKSMLHDLDILRDYNEFPINDYSYSMNTPIPYVHYRFLLPTVKVPGNYLIMVYRDGNKSDLILTKRILIFQGLTSLSQDDNISGLGNLRSTNQALNFTVNYGRIEVINPSSSVHVTIRQNQRWDNASKDVVPNIIREDIRQLEYRFFDMDNTFSAGNEFRFVDFRSLNSPGINTARIDKSQKPFVIQVAQDAPRNNMAYTQFPDKNGGFIIENLDTRQDPWTSCNYVQVDFTLRTSKLDQDVYVIGGYNNWMQSEENKMTYNNGMYTCRQLLKQGFYDYQYWVSPVGKSKNGNLVEGNYFQTENLYEVLVYYRPYQPNADLLVGYFLIPVNSR